MMLNEIFYSVVKASELVLTTLALYYVLTLGYKFLKIIVNFEYSKSTFSLMYIKAYIELQLKHNIKKFFFNAII